MKHSESIPTKKNFRPKFFDLVIFSLFGPFLPKNDRVRAKNFTREKIFDFEIFVLKYVSKDSESIPNKKFLTKKISKVFIFWSFLVFFDCFLPFSNFLGRKVKKCFYQKIQDNFSSLLSHQPGLYDLRCGWGTRIH